MSWPSYARCRCASDVDRPVAGQPGDKHETKEFTMSTGPAGGSAGRTRASDAEREEYARQVREAVGEGRLSLDEGDERLAAVYAAKYRDELAPLLTDLPRAEERTAGPSYRRGGPGSHGPRSEGVGPRGAGQGDGRGDGPWHGSGEGWGPRRGFFRPAIAVALVAAVLVGVWALSAANFFWPAIPLFFLGLFLLRRACWMGYAYNRRGRW
jgi:hypothetical protein